MYAVSVLASWVGDAVDVDEAVDSRVMGTEAGGLGTAIALGHNAVSGDGTDIMMTEPDGADGVDGTTPTFTYTASTKVLTITT